MCFSRNEGTGLGGWSESHLRALKSAFRAHRVIASDVEGVGATGEAAIAALAVDDALVGVGAVLDIDPFAALALQDAHSALPVKTEKKSVRVSSRNKCSPTK